MTSKKITIIVAFEPLKAFCTRVHLFTEHERSGFAPVLGEVTELHFSSQCFEQRNTFKIRFPLPFSVLLMVPSIPENLPYL